MKINDHAFTAHNQRWCLFLVFIPISILLRIAGNSLTLCEFFLKQSSLFGMGPPCQIDVKLAKPEGRKNATIKDRNGSTYKAPVFMVSAKLSH